MSKRYSIFLCVMFCLFIGVFAVAHLILPDRAFSENENKSLELMPTLKAEDFKLSFPALKESGDFFNGTFMSKFETYFTDQFPLRDPFITVKAACELAVGKTVNNDVYFGKDDTLFAGVAKPEEGEVDKRLEYVETLAQNLKELNIPTYFSLVPNKLNINGELLIDPVAGKPFVKDAPLALSVNYLGEDMWQKAAAMTHANWVDMFGLFEEHADEELFYRTDHHWTSLGAYYGYVALMNGMGLKPVSLDEYEKTTVSDSFLGTTYSSSGAGWVEPDNIDIYVPEEGNKVVSYFKGTPEESELYVEEKLTDSLTGSWHMHYWSAAKNSVEFTLEQPVTGLESGTYKFNISIMGGDCGETDIYAFVKVNGEIVARDTMTINGYGNWDAGEVKGVEYTAGDEISVGIYVKCAGEGNGAWGKIDDAKLNKDT